MNRYHYITGFRKEDIEQLKKRTGFLNGQAYLWTSHAKTQMLSRIWDYTLLAMTMKRKLEYDNIIEYYTTQDGQYITKVVYRLKYSDKEDLIIVLNSQKEVITCYLNNIEDKHYTLNPEQYVKI